MENNLDPLCLYLLKLVLGSKHFNLEPVRGSKKEEEPSKWL